MYDVVALGELVVDFTPYGPSDMGHALYEQNFGGAPGNLLCGLAGLGRRTALIGKVGTDMFGDFMADTLQNRGVDTRGLVRDAAVCTTLAFVSLDETGDRSFAFARKPGADHCLRPGEVDEALLRNCRIFHTSAFQMTHEPARSATLHALGAARHAGAIVSFDPNYREPLWVSSDAAIEQIRAVLPFVDLLKVSAGEAALITGEKDPEKAAAGLIDLGLGCVVVTLGAEGSLAITHGHRAQVPALPVKAVDTTGAGDAFWCGFLDAFIGVGRTTADLTGEQLAHCLRQGSATAAISIGRRGAISAPITRQAVADIQAQHGCASTINTINKDAKK